MESPLTSLFPSFKPNVSISGVSSISNVSAQRPLLANVQGRQGEDEPGEPIDICSSVLMRTGRAAGTHTQREMEGARGM